MNLDLQSDPNMQRMMTTMQDPEYKAKVRLAAAEPSLCAAGAHVVP